MIKILRLKISGMNCEHCEKTIEKALSKAEGIKNVKSVSWETGEAVIETSENLIHGRIAKQVKKAGYRLDSIFPLSTPEKKQGKAQFDVVIIGSGSAGFAAAIKAAELGKQAALIGSGTIGGTCVNIGCVPSKFIINEAFSGNTWNRIKTERDRLTDQLRFEKYEKILESYKENITYFSNSAQFIDSTSIRLSDGRIITGEYYILATGSKPAFPDIPGIKDIDALDSTGMMFIDKLPESLLIVGGRFIALELGHAFARLGVKVTLLQRSNRLIPQYDPAISKLIEQIFKDSGIKVITDIKLLGASTERNRKTIQYEAQGEKREVSGDQILFATGRSGNTESLHLDTAGVQLTPSKHVKTDNFFRTSNPNIYAAGDVLDTPGLVYVAAKEGQTALNNALTEECHALRYNAVPEVIFTHPQIARAGLSGEEISAKGIPAASTSFLLADTPYGLAHNNKHGVIILKKNTDSNKLISAEIIAPDAGNMIQTVTVAIKMEMTIEDLADTYFPYLTAVEGIKLGAVIFNKDVRKLSCCAG